MDLFEDAQRRRDVPVIEAENQTLYGLCREVGRPPGRAAA